MAISVDALAPKTAPVVPKSTFRDRAAANPNLTETDILNSANPSPSPPTKSDSTVIGAGIHGLIYAIHARLRHADEDLKISVFEKAPKPQWKIGESTLPHFAQWTKNVGLEAEYLLRLFGLHNGLEFYVLDRENPTDYKEFCNNGPPPFLLPGYQLQRSVSELLFTLFAQRKGVDVWHGHGADVQNTVLSSDGDVIPIKNVADKSSFITKSPLLIDGTGRFRQFSSKAARVKRFEGWNTDAFFGYFEANDEPAIEKEFAHFEGGHTNHICFPEGWLYLIRMISWHESPIPNMMDMIHYLLDAAEAGVPNDQLPSTYELADMFGCKVKWIWSIGFAVRSDSTYPADMSMYGKTEAERRFNFFTQKYPKIQNLMSLFTLLPDYHGPGTTYFIRKQLSYQTTVVSGPGWATIGDGIGFTNPLLSPGINAGMASSTFAADLTVDALRASGKGEEQRLNVWKKYDDYCAKAVPSLFTMNKFLYLSFRHPVLATRVGLMWQIVLGHALPGWSLPKTSFGIELADFAEYATHWLWGSQVEDFVKVSQKTIELLDTGSLDDPVSQEVVDELLAFSEETRLKSMAAGKYTGFPFRYEGELRSFGPNLEYDEEKYVSQDSFANQCDECDSWLALRGDWRKCYTCGVTRKQEVCEIVWNPPLDEYELGMFSNIVEKPLALGASLVEYVESKKGMDGMKDMKAMKMKAMTAGMGAMSVGATVM